LKAQGGAAPTSRKKRKSGKEEWTSDGDESEGDAGDIESDNESSASDVPEGITSGDPKPWVKDPRGKLAVGRFFNAMLLTDDPTHDKIPAKVTRYYLYEKTFNMLEFKFTVRCKHGNTRCQACKKCTRLFQHPVQLCLRSRPLQCITQVPIHSQCNV
jgi:hypothetical protein